MGYCDLRDVKYLLACLMIGAERGFAMYFMDGSLLLLVFEDFSFFSVDVVIFASSLLFFSLSLSSSLLFPRSLARRFLALRSCVGVMYPSSPGFGIEFFLPRPFFCFFFFFSFDEDIEVCAFLLSTGASLSVESDGIFLVIFASLLVSLLFLSLFRAELSDGLLPPLARFRRLGFDEVDLGKDSSSAVMVAYPLCCLLCNVL
mmetsp:Transcript_17208/g.25608  ORF Transcript_17208/g.25608 Transcript_17208/m.25608 type:complete len:202 (+) Transcript_17208:1442-2047(+)